MGRPRLFYLFYMIYRTIGLSVECSPMVRETGVQSQVGSYQRLKKWYLMLLCLTLSVIRYGSRIKWSNPGKGVAPSPIPWCSSYRKGSLRVTLDYCRQLYLFTLFISISDNFISKVKQFLKTVIPSEQL